MRAVLVNAPESMVEERRRRGIDKQDERWGGAWHLVNPPKLWHPRLNSDLFVVLAPLARRRGLVPYCESTGIFASEEDWRVPDQVYARADQEMEEGLTGAELATEIRSPGDESYAKLPFYAARGVTEVLIIHRDRRVELFRLDGRGGYSVVPDGTSEVLGVTFTTVDGPALRVSWSDGSADV